MDFRIVPWTTKYDINCNRRRVRMAKYSWAKEISNKVVRTYAGALRNDKISMAGEKLKRQYDTTQFTLHFFPCKRCIFANYIQCERCGNVFAYIIFIIGCIMHNCLVKGQYTGIMWEWPMKTAISRQINFFAYVSHLPSSSHQLARDHWRFSEH